MPRNKLVQQAKLSFRNCPIWRELNDLAASWRATTSERTERYDELRVSVWVNSLHSVRLTNTKNSGCDKRGFGLPRINQTGGYKECDADLLFRHEGRWFPSGTNGTGICYDRGAIEHSKELASRLRRDPRIRDRSFFDVVIDESGAEVHRETPSISTDRKPAQLRTLALLSF